MTRTLRPSQESDVLAIDALLARVYPKLLAPDYPADVLTACLPAMTTCRPELITCGTWYVIEEAGQILAAGGWTRDRNDPALGHIRHVVCDDRHVRRGLARSLLETSFARARASGVQAMECWSTLTAVPFYQASGFEIMAPIDVEMGNGTVFPSVRMRRDL